MKKLLIFVALIGASLTTYAAAISSQFLTYGDNLGYVSITNDGVAYLHNYTNVIYYFPSVKTNVLSKTAKYQHGTSWYTNTTWSAVTTNYAGYKTTNSQQFAGPYKIAKLQGNPDGSVSLGKVLIEVVATNGVCYTNTIVFAGVIDGVVDTLSSKLWSVAVPNTATTNATGTATTFNLTTNAPTALLQGCDGLMIYSITGVNAASDGVNRIKVRYSAPTF